MSENEVTQEEEREVLASIYEGDKNYKQIDKNTYQYKYGEDGSRKSFLLEVKWGASYPEELPSINTELFYNNHLLPSIKEKIVEVTKTEAEQYLGMSMTYSLFEFIKDKVDELLADQPEQDIPVVDKLCISEDKENELGQNVKKERKEQLTKAQKRRQWKQMDSKGEKPRGWNWVDIVKHLSQTGYVKEDKSPIS